MSFINQFSEFNTVCLGEDRDEVEILRFCAHRVSGLLVNAKEVGMKRRVPSTIMNRIGVKMKSIHSRTVSGVAEIFSYRYVTVSVSQ